MVLPGVAQAAVNAVVPNSIEHEIIEQTKTITVPDNSSSYAIIGWYSYYDYDGNIDGYNIILSGTTPSANQVFAVDGGTTDYGFSANNNVKITNFKIIDRVLGAYAGSNATYNNVYIKNSIVGDTIFYGVVQGGSSTNGAALDNKVEIYDSKIGYCIAGGLAKGSKKNAERNKVIIKSSTVGELKKDGYINGGFSSCGSALTNTVDISDSNIYVDIFGGEAWGEADENGNGNAEGNKVFISASAVGMDSNKVKVYGGYSSKNNASDNEVNISDHSTVDADVYGGWAYGNAESNTVNITNSTVGYTAGDDQISVTGGYSENGAALKNVVNISNSKIAGNIDFTVSGGLSKSGEASNNKIYISEGSSVSATVYGGFTINGNANNNTVKIIESAVSSIVSGGDTTNGNANNNAVYITSSTVGGNVTGGYSTNGNATGNDVYIADASTIYGSIYGGNVYSPIKEEIEDNDSTISTYSLSNNDSSNTTSTASRISNNTLHVSGLNNKAYNIYNFDKFEFDITDAYADGSVMLQLTGDDNTQITNNVNVSLSIAGDTKIDNRTISLIAKEGEENIKVDGKILGFGDEQEVTLTQGTTLEYKATLKVEENDQKLNLIIGDGEAIGGDKPQGIVNDKGKSIVETRAGAGFVVNNMVDFMLSSGMTQAQAAVDEDDTCAPFVAVGGSNTRYNTGSHIDVDGWNAIVGFARQSGNATYGVAVEHGRGDYDSYVGAVHGEGDIKSTGGALFAHIKNANGVHYDASLRAGKVDTDYKSGTTSYDDDATYYGLTLGAGKELKVTEKATLDLYGRYFFSHIAGSDVRLSSGEAVDFDAVDSHRIRLGGRYTSEINEKSSAYAGLAWQYEFGGDAEAAINGISAPTPSLQGHSAVIETGYTLQSGKNMSQGFNVTGWLGKQRGIGGTLGAQWSF